MKDPGNLFTAWAVTQLGSTSDDDWCEVPCELCPRVLRSADRLDQHLIEDHGLEA